MSSREDQRVADLHAQLEQERAVRKREDEDRARERERFKDKERALKHELEDKEREHKRKLEDIELAHKRKLERELDEKERALRGALKREREETEREKARVKRLRHGLRMKDASTREIEAIEDREIPTPARSKLELLPIDVFGIVAEHLPVPDLLGSLAVASQALREAVRRGRATRGWNTWIRKALKKVFELGMDKSHGFNFLVMDENAGRVNIIAAACWGYRPARARCKWGGWGECEVDIPGAVSLLQAEHASSPSAESGGKCGWTVLHLASRYRRGDGGVELDYPKALELYHKAADDYGNVWAKTVLGEVYLLGQFGAARDRAKSLAYYRSASEAGCACSSGNLGLRHERGIPGILDIDLGEAARLLEIAEERDRVRVAQWRRSHNRVLQKIAGTWQEEGEGEEEEEGE